MSEHLAEHVLLFQPELCGWPPLIRDWFWFKQKQWELSLDTQRLAAVDIVTGNVVPLS